MMKHTDDFKREAVRIAPFAAACCVGFGRWAVDAMELGIDVSAG
jgi:hypothetical protein